MEQSNLSKICCLENTAFTSIPPQKNGTIKFDIPQIASSNQHLTCIARFSYFSSELN
jgi:hypothetical protein